MINFESRWYRLLACSLTFSLTALSVPTQGIRFTGGPAPAEPVEKKARSRVLSAQDLNARSGKISIDPFVSGTTKLSVVHNGVDILTGNFTASATDLSFQGGYGIPVAASRNYSANNGDEGPFGYGWINSVDIRTTAGGVLKSAAAPTMATPVSFRERPPLVTNGGPQSPGTQNPPVDAVIAVDASGYQEIMARDADGILSTPPWDRNVSQPEYEFVSVTTNNVTKTYWIIIANTLTTPEGTVYRYEKQGYYDQSGGILDLGNPNEPRTPSNVLKIAYVKDRNGNTTYYEYDQSVNVAYQKLDGRTSEKPLKRIWMPDGDATVYNSPSTRYLQFAYNETHTGGSTPPANRITSVTDGSRTVKYLYDSGGNLAQVISPGLKRTKYEYTTFTGDGGTTNVPLLVSMRDHRGLTTRIAYGKVVGWFGGYRPYACRVILPNGLTTYVCQEDLIPPTIDWPMDTEILDGSGFMGFQDRVGFTETNNGTMLAYGRLDLSYPTVPDRITQKMYDYSVAAPGGGANYAYVPSWEKTFYAFNRDLIEESRYTYPAKRSAYATDLSVERRLQSTPWARQLVRTEITNNFRGNPLLQKSFERESTSVSSWTGSESQVGQVETAYWGPEKYFQQKATRTKDKDGTYRYSLTDYFAWDDTSVGKRGQVNKVYDPKYATFTHTGSYPSNTPTTPDDFTWGYKVAASGIHAAEFAYDSQGRPTSVKKLQSVSGSTGTYVETTTSYQSGTSHWGYPYEVVEDAGGINRKTMTYSYNHAGQPTVTYDTYSGSQSYTAGRKLETTYLTDGEVDKVDKTSGTTANLVDYQYNSVVDPDGSGVTDTQRINSGMVLWIKDGPSNIKQTFTYVPANGSAYIGGIGQISTVYEDKNDYTMSYSYNSLGQRSEATISSWNGDTTWVYDDYIALGSPDSYRLIFQSLNRMDSDKIDDQIQYQFDTSGRLLETAFALHPQVDQYSAKIWNNANYPATKRIRQFNQYLPAGQVSEVTTREEAWATNAYTSSLKYDAAYTYDTHTRARNWFALDDLVASPTVTYEQDYGYDAKLGYLTSAGYEKTVHSTTPVVTTASDAWGYDAAGNRNSETHNSSTSTAFTHDALNRMSQSANWTGSAFGTAFSYTHDVRGNRTQRGSSTVQNSGYALYTFDELNRMTKQVSAGNGATFSYRADGQRTMKVKSHTLTWNVTGQDSGFYDEDEVTNQPTTRYMHDGQMVIEEDYQSDLLNDVPFEVTRYGLGARGIDYIEKFDGIETTTHAYPIYDGHGNMISTVSKSGTGYAYGVTRVSDAWGQLAWGASDGIQQRYCASLGHQKDDETGGLVYMRARYYEPTSGRFVSEDPALDGRNWFVYANNDPVANVDPSGKSASGGAAGYIYGLSMLVGTLVGIHCGQLAFRAAMARGIAIGLSNRLDRDVLELLTESHSLMAHIITHGVAFTLEFGMLAAGYGPAAGAVGSATLSGVGLAFAIGFFTGFIAGFYSDLVRSAIFEMQVNDR